MNYLDNITIQSIKIEDVAFALSNLSRFCGQTTFYSVAQHSLDVAAMLPAKLKLSGLLHDATEAYVGDVITPIKRQVPLFYEIEHKIMELIIEKYKIDPYNKLVKKADTLACEIEMIRFKNSKNFRTENQEAVYNDFLEAFEKYKDLQ